MLNSDRVIILCYIHVILIYLPLGRKVGTCLLGRRNSGRFHYKLIHEYVLISFQTKETTFCWKTVNLVYFHTFTYNVNTEGNCVIILVMCIYQLFRLAKPNKGLVCIAPIGNSFRIRLAPGPRHPKWRLELRMFTKSKLRKVFRLFPR